MVFFVSFTSDRIIVHPSHIICNVIFIHFLERRIIEREEFHVSPEYENNLSLRTPSHKTNISQEVLLEK